MKRIIIVEDEAIIATEIKYCCEDLGYDVVGIFNNGDKALDGFRNLNPDIVLLDINIKGTLNGIDLAKIIREKYSFPFVFLTSYSDQATLDVVQKVLPYGYIVKPFTDSAIRTNIQLALFKYEQESLGSFPSSEQISKQCKIELTDREYQVFQGIYNGLSNKEMAAQYHISINTVKTYLKSLFIKLNISSRVEAMKKAIEMMKK